MAVVQRNRVVWTIALGTGAGLTLVAYGFAEHPQARLLSVAAASAVLIAYGAIGFSLKRPRWSAVAVPAFVAGLGGGAVFAAEILLE